LVIPFGVLLAAFSRLLVELAFTGSYLAGYPAFVISSLFAIVPAYFMLYVTALQATGNTRSLIVIAVVSLMSDLVASYYLIIQFGMIGAAFARIVMFVATLLTSYGFLRRKVNPSFDFGSLKKTTLFSLTLGVPLLLFDFFFLEAYGFSLLFRFIILAGSSLLLFFVAGFVWKPLSENDLEVLRKASPKKLAGLTSLIGKIFCEKHVHTKQQPN
jgi:O-antigen/teichoic acid export membrane protein